ncbi:hypothetical protein KEM52_002667, partial [Ascosphaera acerosa]
AEEGRRLYIGNLAYAATDAELKDFFKNYSVESTSIPMNPRTNRPVGYAFVDLASVEQAQAAIAALSGQEILERKVSVQLAQKPEPHADGEAAEGRRRGQGRTRGRGRGRGGRAPRPGRVTGDAIESPAQPAVDQSAAAAAPLADATNGNASSPEQAKDAADRSRRAPRHRGPPEDGIPSKTKVMVANLPYDLTEDKLKELFAAYTPLSAKVALRPIPRFMVKKLIARNEPRKGRGFGFVTLASEESQQKAVKEMNGKVIEGREIAVKVAIDSPGKEDAREEAAVAAATASANTNANGDKKAAEPAVAPAAASAAAPAAAAAAAPAASAAAAPVAEKDAPAPATAATAGTAAPAPAPAGAAPAGAPAQQPASQQNKDAAPAVSAA